MALLTVRSALPNARNLFCRLQRVPGGRSAVGAGLLGLIKPPPPAGKPRQRGESPFDRRSDLVQEMIPFKFVVSFLGFLRPKRIKFKIRLLSDLLARVYLRFGSGIVAASAAFVAVRAGTTALEQAQTDIPLEENTKQTLALIVGSPTSVPIQLLQTIRR